ncbi:hypothetical protein ACP4OV_018826 [Aristida adscensionis]
MAAGGGEAETRTYTTDEALSRLGFGRFQALLLGVLGTGWVAEAMEIMMLSFVGPSVKAEWGVSGEQEGLVTSAVFVGMLAGACVGGLVSDRHGRRVAFLFTALVTGISGFLCAFSPNYASFLALRFIVGIGLGGSHVLPTWFLEFVPAENRGFWMAVFTSFWTVGAVLEALLAWATMPILGWRWLLALSSSPCFVVLIFLGLIPESPRYLCSRGKTSDAMLVLERIGAINNKALPPGILTSDSKRKPDNNNGASVTTLLLTMENSLGTDEHTGFKSSGFSAFSALWSRDLIKSTLLLWLINFSSYFAYYAMVLLTSEVSNDRSCASVGEHPMQPKNSSLYINVLVTSFAEFPGYLLAALLSDKVGRRMSVGGMTLLCCASLVPLALTVHLGRGLVIILLFCARTFIQGTFAVLHAYSPEVYPTFCRNTGVGVATSMGRVGSIVAPLLTTALLENCHQKEAVFVTDLLLFAAGVACAFFPLETKGREM